MYFYDELEPTPEPYPEEVEDEPDPEITQGIATVASAWSAVTGNPLADMIKYLTNLRMAYQYMPRWPIHYMPEPEPEPKPIPSSYGLMQVIPPNFNLRTNDKYKAEQLKPDIEFIKNFYKNGGRVHKVDDTWQKGWGSDSA